MAVKQEAVYWVYLLRCGDGSFYAGIAKDPARRLALHQAGRGAKYTRGRGPLALVYLETCGDRSAALRREAALKRLRAEEKRRLAADWLAVQRKAGDGE